MWTSQTVNELSYHFSNPFPFPMICKLEGKDAKDKSSEEDKHFTRHWHHPESAQSLLPPQNLRNHRDVHSVAPASSPEPAEPPGRSQRGSFPTFSVDDFGALGSGSGIAFSV
ncbi:hypothetical protein CB1_000569030 [Camelus ferus]|nr:hypothetical protein CB1_000569030 [Camelus ferus]